MRPEPRRRILCEMLGPGPRFCLGVYVFEAVEILDFAGPCGVFSIAARLNPRLEIALIADYLRPVRVQAGVTVVPNRSIDNAGNLDALLLPGGPGFRRELNNSRLHRFIAELPEHTLLASVCSGSLILGRIGLLDGRTATSRKEADPAGSPFSPPSPFHELARVAPRASLSTARLVDSGRIITSAGAASGLDLGFHLLRRAGHSESFASEVARMMDYTLGYEIYLEDVEVARI